MHVLLTRSCGCRFSPVSPPGDESGEEEEDGERLDQQMGEAGPEGEDVDERLWNDEDREEEQQGQVRSRAVVRWSRASLDALSPCSWCSVVRTARAPGYWSPLPPACCIPLRLCTVQHATALLLPRPVQEQEGPDDKSVQVGDKSQLDYAAGGEEDEQASEQEGRDQQQQEQQQDGAAEEQPQPQAGVEEEQEEEELGDYQDRCGLDGVGGAVVGRRVGLQVPCVACGSELGWRRHGPAVELEAAASVTCMPCFVRRYCVAAKDGCCPGWLLPTNCACIVPSSEQRCCTCSPPLPCRPEDRGHVQPEAAEPEFELPEDLNLDGGEAGEEAEQPEGEEDQVGRWGRWGCWVVAGERSLRRPVRVDGASAWVARGGGCSAD